MRKLYKMALLICSIHTQQNCGEVVHMPLSELSLGISVICMIQLLNTAQASAYMQKSRSVAMHVFCRLAGRRSSSIGRSGLLPLSFPLLPTPARPAQPFTTVSPPLDRSSRIPEAFHTKSGVPIPGSQFRTAITAFQTSNHRHGCLP